MPEPQPETTGWLRGILADEVRQALMASLCRLLYRDRDGEEVAVGCAFIIGATEHGAFCMTATHVLVEMSRREHPPRSHATSPFSRDSLDLARPLREGRIRA